MTTCIIFYTSDKEPEGKADLDKMSLWSLYSIIMKTRTIKTASGNVEVESISSNTITVSSHTLWLFLVLFRAAFSETFCLVTTSSGSMFSFPLTLSYLTLASIPLSLTDSTLSLVSYNCGCHLPYTHTLKVCFYGYFLILFFFPPLLYSKASAMGWMFVSPLKLISWNPNPQCYHIWKWGHWKMIRFRRG